MNDIQIELYVTWLLQFLEWAQLSFSVEFQWGDDVQLQGQGEY